MRPTRRARHQSSRYLPPTKRKKAARDILLGHACELVKAQGTVIGLPRLRAGSRVLCDGIGSRLAGEYFVTETTHTLNASGYLTRFTARREDPDTGETIGGRHESRRALGGIVIGKVTAVKDEEGLGRIQVTYPWLSGPETRWVPSRRQWPARTAARSSCPRFTTRWCWASIKACGTTRSCSASRGIQQKSPSGDERQRMIRSKNGHTIRFVDSTPTGGNQGALIIEDAHGSVITMTNGRVSIHSQGSLELTGASVTIQNRLVRPIGGPI